METYGNGTDPESNEKVHRKFTFLLGSRTDIYILFYPMRKVDKFLIGSFFNLKLGRNWADPDEERLREARGGLLKRKLEEEGKGWRFDHFSWIFQSWTSLPLRITDFPCLKSLLFMVIADGSGDTRTGYRGLYKKLIKKLSRSASLHSESHCLEPGQGHASNMNRYYSIGVTLSLGVVTMSPGFSKRTHVNSDHSQVVVMSFYVLRSKSSQLRSCRIIPLVIEQAAQVVERFTRIPLVTGSSPAYDNFKISLGSTITGPLRASLDKKDFFIPSSFYIRRGPSPK
ncbi:hypothetical protein VNO77_02032 [Canavalia gladiata]|uniref:Uncharacterized protein n=1 Tax=Canavalia gladiata TaxID=3824 RepID=A0AAN9MSA8_CANGL